ncbi:unnamed protein product [Gongylonema pulchrum]|uniref:Aa_trans domain-containing protein n=1 Tax=Gongylonema pulchrum TaxID=637853 RepID=A0A183CYC7_9BILA|nr:unnamed protein product [Gongylonema pulchrum]
MVSKSQGKHGIGWVVAAMFILADLVGGGVVAMPAGFVQTGLMMGIIFMITICTFFSSTGWLLADTWDIMCTRWPEYRGHCRKPYPEMGLKSIGKRAEVVIVAAVLCTVTAILLIFVGVSLDLPTCYPESVYPGPSFNSIFSLGIFLFAFNGHQVFPTVQNDMHHPPDFKKSIILVVALLYMPLSIYSFMVYGNSMQNSVIDSIQTPWIRSVADLAIAVHCILTIIITVNPINLQLEETFGIPHKFCTKRVLVRTALMALMLFIGLTIPNFSSVMDLFGSTTVPCTCIILPSLFNLYIRSAEFDQKANSWKAPTFGE